MPVASPENVTEKSAFWAPAASTIWKFRRKASLEMIYPCAVPPSSALSIPAMVRAIGQQLREVVCRVFQCGITTARCSCPKLRMLSATMNHVPSDVRIGQTPRHRFTRQRGAAVRAGTVENRSYEKSVGMHRPRQLRILPQLTRDGTIQRQSCHKEPPMFRVTAPPKPQTPGPSRPSAPAPHEGRPG